MLGLVACAVITCWLWRRKWRHSGNHFISVMCVFCICCSLFILNRNISLVARKNKAIRNERQVFNINDVKIQDLPLLKFEELAAATNNFEACNKLGQGIYICVCVYFTSRKT